MLTVPTEHAQINDALILESTRLMAKSLPPTQKIVGVLRLLSEWANLPYGRVMVPNYSTQRMASRSPCCPPSAQRIWCGATHRTWICYASPAPCWGRCYC